MAVLRRRTESEHLEFVHHSTTWHKGVATTAKMPRNGPNLFFPGKRMPPSIILWFFFPHRKMPCLEKRKEGEEKTRETRKLPDATMNTSQVKAPFSTRAANFLHKTVAGGLVLLAAGSFVALTALFVDLKLKKRARTIWGGA